MIVSLIISSIMLGQKCTSLVAIIRTTNRKQELEMLVGELKRARSSEIRQALITRARRASELGEPGTELVCRFVCPHCSKASGSGCIGNVGHPDAPANSGAIGQFCRRWPCKR